MDTKFFVKVGTIFAFVAAGGRLIGMYPSVLEVVVVLLGIMMVIVFALVTFCNLVCFVTMFFVAPVSAIPIGVFGVIYMSRGQLKFLDCVIKFKFLFLFLMFKSKVLVSPVSHNSTFNLFACITLPPLLSFAVASLI